MRKLAVILFLFLFFFQFGCVKQELERQTIFNSYHVLFNSQFNYDLIMTRAGEKYELGLFSEEDKETLMEVATVFYQKYRTASAALLSFKRKQELSIVTDMDNRYLERVFNDFEEAYLNLMITAQTLEVM